MSQHKSSHTSNSTSAIFELRGNKQNYEMRTLHTSNSTSAISEWRGNKQNYEMQALQIPLLLLTPTYGLFITISQKIWVFLVQVPVKQQVLVNYIAYLFSRDYVATTVIACFSVVSYIHKLYNLKDHVHLFWYKNCCAQPVSIFCTTQSLYIISYSF